MRKLQSKIVGSKQAAARVKAWRKAGEKIVFANGCFDLLHAGHVRFLEAARRKGDRLVVAVNDDASVRRLKGPERPILPEWQRAEVLAALESTDLIILFSEDDVTGLLNLVKPDFHVKGGNYNRLTVNQAELRVLKSFGGRLAFAPQVNGWSSTRVIARARDLQGKQSEDLRVSI